MQVKDILTNKNYSNSKNKLKTIAIAIDDSKIDNVLDSNSDIYPASYRAWHAAFIKQKGLEIWLRCVSTARQEGKSPERYLVWLLKRAI